MTLPMWIIYDRPSDFPEQFVARKWIMDKPTSEVMTASDLAGIRWAVGKVAPGSVCLARDPSDDPKIVETWL